MESWPIAALAAQHADSANGVGSTDGTDNTGSAGSANTAPSPAGNGSDIDRVIALYRQVGRDWRAGEPADWGAGVTVTQLRLLYFLGRCGPASVGEVAAALSVAQSSATEILDRLVRAGLVARMADPADRRVVRSVLTDAGREVTEGPWALRRTVLATALRSLSADEREAIIHGLDVLGRALASVATRDGNGQTDSIRRE